MPVPPIVHHRCSDLARVTNRPGLCLDDFMAPSAGATMGVSGHVGTDTAVGIMRLRLRQDFIFDAVIR
jgi:hypothetical protein